MCYVLQEFHNGSLQVYSLVIKIKYIDHKRQGDVYLNNTIPWAEG